MTILEIHSHTLTIMNRNIINMFKNENKAHINNLVKNKKSHSSKNNNLLRIHQFDKFEINISAIKAKRNHLNILSQNIHPNLLIKYSGLFDRKKFKLSNRFDAKNSKEFLKKKDKCLEKISLSDKIEVNDKNEVNDKKYNSKKKSKKKKYKTQKNLQHYFIIISNYDEEMKNNNSQKKLYIKQKLE